MYTYGGGKQYKNVGEISLPFLNLDMVLKISYHLQESSPSFDKVNELEYLWWKVKRKQTHFLSDVVAAVTILGS